MTTFFRIVPLIIILFAGHAFTQSTQLLFSLGRSKNINRVFYEAQIAQDGLLNPKEPIHIYWILWAKDSTGRIREELSLLEKNMAYGCKIEKYEGRNHCSMIIVSYPDRVIDVSLHEGKVTAQIVIDKNVSYLDSVFICYRETRMFPKVNYIELFGRAVETGVPQHEKIKPK
jgi:hypothetical protein